MLRRSSKCLVSLAVVGILCLGGCYGCDPVKTTAQQVRLRLFDGSSRRPLAGTELLIKIDFEAAYQGNKEMVSEAEEYRQHLREHWELQPWFPGVTNDAGEASILINYAVLDRTRGAKPPATRDWVTGQRYLVKVKPRELPEETLSLLMKPGESTKGRAFTATVVEIREPRYVDPK